MKYPILKTALLTAVLAAATPTAQAGWIKRYIYNNMPGTLVTNLLAGTNTSGVVVFPDSPDSTELIPPGNYDPSFLAQSASGIGDTYGSYTPGYIEPPETGNYTFWVSGDDEVQLWLTSDATDPLNPATKQMIAGVPAGQWTNPNEWTKYPEQKSATVYLEKGKQYYMEILHKEGTGGDSIGWGWQLPSGLVERPMRTFYLQPRKNNADTVLVSNPYIANIAPRNGDPTVYDGMEVMVCADLNLVPPYSVQWLRNGTEIPGATQTYYRMRARTSDNGAQFSIRVNGIVYGPATLYVMGDTVAPTLVSATIPGNNPTQIQLVFSESITPTTANDVTKYSLNTATVQGAQLQVDGCTVLLTTTLLNPTQYNTLTISGLQDWALPVNTLQTLQTNLAIVDGSLSFRIWNSVVATDLTSLRNWSNTNSTTASYINEQFDEERIITTNTYGWALIPLRNNYAGQMIGYITPPETGNYKFAIASDDQSILYLGTNELASSKREICNQSGSTGQWNFSAANARSAYIPLVAGKRYYIEAVYRDGTGGDGVTIGWEKPSDTTAGNLMYTGTGNTYALIAAWMIPTNYISSYRAFGPVFFKSDLTATVSAAESTRPVLKVVANGTAPYSYQWYRNNSPIAGATAASYTLPYVRQADNNATYFVVVTNNFSSATSVVATLTVTADSGKPSVASVGSLYKQTVEVQLSEPVSAATATDLANYLLFSSSGTAVAITSAVQDTNDAAHITLKTAALPEADLMKLVVQNLADLSSGANVMAPATNSFRANNFDTLVRIGNSQAYSARAVGDQIFLTAGGSDIWGTGDQCAFLYKTVTGNFDYKVQGVSVPAINAWTKAGVMARVDTSGGSRNAIALFTPSTPAQNTYSAQIRDTAAGNSTSTGDAGTPLNVSVQGGVATRPTVAYPSWLRLQRVGNVIYYYYCNNSYGTNWTYWTFYDSASTTGGPLPATLQLGLALTSHDTGRTADVTMASFSTVDDGALRFSLQPTNAIVVEGGTAKFYSAVAGRSPYFIQWAQDNNPISYGTNANMSITNVPFSYNNATITCTVTNPYGEKIVATVKLLVQNPDNTKPTVAKVGSLYKNTVEVYFSEPVTAASAGNPANYTLRSASGATVAVSGATPAWDDAAHVTLMTADMPDFDLMQLACQGMVDMSLAANVMDRQTNIFRANNFEPLENINTTQNFSARAEGDQIFMTAGGADIWNTADGCAFLYKKVSGNFDIKVQGISLPQVNGQTWCKMGLMARNSPGGFISSGDRNLFSCFTPLSPGQNTYSPQVRTNTGSATTAVSAGEPLLVNLQAGVTARPTVVYPSWLRLQRIGDKFYYYYSTTGTNWTFWTWYDSATSTEGALPQDLLLGLALTSHETGYTVDGVMASFSPVNDGPMRFLTEPVSTNIIEGANATFSASVIGRGPYTYQWLKNDVVIPNATGTAVALTNVPFSENGSRYVCRVTNPYGDSLTSSNAILTVIQDTFKPVTFAVGSLRGTNVGVYFSDDSRIDPVTAGNPANYTVNNGAVTVTSATVEPDGLAVMLGLSAAISGDFSVTVRNVKDAAPIPNTMDTVTLQSTVVSWPNNQDIGAFTGTPPVFSDPIMPGFAQAIGTNGYYVHAGGSDIWNAADGMHFVYQPVSGNFDMAVRVTNLRNADVWSKAGLMVRADLDNTSRNYLIATTPVDGNNLITMQWRPDKNVASTSLPDNMRPRPGLIPNAWLRMTRADQVFTFYYGTNGTDWVTLYTTNEVATPYPAAVYVGLATTSHNNGNSLTNTTGAYFQNVTGFTVPVVARPTLAVAVQGANLALTWTTSDASLKLQSSSSIATGWADDPATVAVAGNTRTVTVPLGTGAKFYRLSK